MHPPTSPYQVARRVAQGFREAKTELEAGAVVLEQVKNPPLCDKEYLVVLGEEGRLAASEEGKHTALHKEFEGKTEPADYYDHSSQDANMNDEEPLVKQEAVEDEENDEGEDEDYQTLQPDSEIKEEDESKPLGRRLPLNDCPYCGQEGVVLVQHLNTCIVGASPAAPIYDTESRKKKIGKNGHSPKKQDGRSLKRFEVCAICQPVKQVLATNRHLAEFHTVSSLAVFSCPR